ncbi:MAG: AMP-binding protein, partial [Clostridia bacterium]
NYLSYDRLYEEGKALLESGYNGYVNSQSNENELKMLVYTSGTTGNSKGVMLSEHNLCSCVYYGLQVSTIYDVGLSVLPFHHTYESVCGLLVGIHWHSTLCINDSLRSTLANFKVYRPMYIYLVPALAEMFHKRIWRTVKEQGKTNQLKLLIKISNALRRMGIDLRRKFFSSIHETFGGRLVKIVCGGAPIRPEVGEFFEDIGISLVNGYGITECSPLVSANREEFNSFNTAGLKLPCVDVKIESPDEFGNGEICVKGDTVMLGYYKDKAQTEAVLKNGWFYTGDFGNVNAYGQITITGRKKNIIVLDNGKNIYPEELEDYIMSIPYVTEVVVYATSDENGNQSGLCAEAFLDEEKLVDLKIDDASKKLKDDIFVALKDLPIYKQVTRVVLRKIEFEKTTSKKIKRAVLKH